MTATERPILSLETGYHLRAKPLYDGRVKMENFELKAVPFAEDGKGHEQFLAGAVPIAALHSNESVVGKL